MKLIPILRLFKQAFQEWQKDKVSRLAAALAYYTVFSVAPLLIIAIAIAGAVFGKSAAEGQLMSQLEGLVGNEASGVIEIALKNASQPGTGSIASLISIGVLLIGASGVFAQLQDALNTVWNVQPKPGRGVGGFIRKRLLSFCMVLAIGFLLILSLIISTVISTLSKYNTDFLPGSDFLWSHIDFFVSLGLRIFMFALMYKYVPDVKIAWKDVLVGAIITALLFSFGQFLLERYLSQSSAASAYGAAGSLIVFLAWVYYSAQIILFGAEFTQVYAHRYGSKIIPDKHAQWL
ncbi:MAG: YihY/virulence factor BrkB family protein [Xenococcaceae cyanobacterium MO_188.B32]|nr:YihY/virulence factor BrkB family protein [Xenococcaceae cyanobacterium MO_188.B32]